MQKSAHILFPYPPRTALHLGLPAITGLVIYAVIRIIADSNNHGFIDWKRPLWLFALECSWTIINAFLTFEMTIRLRLWLYKRVFEGNSAQKIVSPTEYLLKEVRWIYCAVLVFGNTLGLPFTALTDDGLSFFDFFVNNLVTVVFITAYLLATRGRDYIRLFNQAELDLERYKQERATAQFQALQHQLNPHFLFNSLNTLSSLVHRDADAADEFIRELANVYRYVLEATTRETVALRRELVFLESYNHLLKTRFKSAFELTISIREEYLDLHLPPMTLQILVENAVKHNIVSAKKPLHCLISDTDKACLLIKNNLQERSEKDTSSSVGLANLQSRYTFLSSLQDRIQPSVSKTTAEFIVSVPLLELDETKLLQTRHL